MKSVYFLSLTFLMLLLATPSFAVNSAPKPVEKNKVEQSSDINSTAKDWNDLSKKEKRKVRKQMRKNMKSKIKKALKQGGDTDLAIIILFAILIPPLGMALYEGLTTRFWISLLLTLLLWLPGAIYTLYVILSEN